MNEREREEDNKGEVGGKRKLSTQLNSVEKAIGSIHSRRM